MQHDIYKKEYSIRQILSESWKQFKEHANLIFLTILVVYYPINKLLFLVEEWSTGMSEIQEFSFYMKIGFILEFFIGIIPTMAIAYLVKQSIDGKKVELKDIFKKAFSRWPAAIGTSLLMLIALIGLTFLFIVPGIIYSFYWYFLIFVVVLQDKSGKAALNYSKSIVRGRWWKVVGYFLVFSLLALLIVGLMLFLDSALYTLVPNSFYGSTFELVFETTMDFVYSYFTVVGVIFFINFDSTKSVDLIDNEEDSTTVI